MATLTSKQLKDSYQGLLTIKTADDANPLSGRLENGLGNAITNLGIGIDSGLTYPLTIKEDTNNSYIHFVNSTTGSLFSDGSQIGVPSGSSDFLINNRESANIRFLTSGDEKLRIEADGDIAFYDDANNQGLFWDASAGSLGIGTSSIDSSDGRLKLSAPSGNSNPSSIALYGNNGGAFGGSNVVRSKIDSITDGTAFGADMRFFTNDTSNVYQERMRIDSSGNVGIGTDSPLSILHVNGADAIMRLSDTNGGTSFIGHDSTGAFWRTFTTDTHRFQRASGTESMRIDSSGNLDMSAGGGNVILSSGAGIDFSDTPNSSGTMTSELLDDYEEGTWSPVITDGTNDATMIGGAGGTYTKIGRQVTLTGYVRTTALGSVSGYIFIKNLPFSANATTTFGLSNAFGFGSGLNLTAGQSVGGKLEGGTSIGLTVWDNTAGSTAMQASEWTDDGFIFISLTYFV